MTPAESLENVAKFKNLGTTVTYWSGILEEIDRFRGEYSAEVNMNKHEKGH